VKQVSTQAEQLKLGRRQLVKQLEQLVATREQQADTASQLTQQSRQLFETHEQLVGLKDVLKQQTVLLEEKKREAEAQSVTMTAQTVELREQAANIEELEAELHGLRMGINGAAAEKLNDRRRKETRRNLAEEMMDGDQAPRQRHSIDIPPSVRKASLRNLRGEVEQARARPAASTSGEKVAAALQATMLALDIADLDHSKGASVGAAPVPAPATPTHSRPPSTLRTGSAGPVFCPMPNTPPPPDRIAGSAAPGLPRGSKAIGSSGTLELLAGATQASGAASEASVTEQGQDGNACSAALPCAPVSRQASEVFLA